MYKARCLPYDFAPLYLAVGLDFLERFGYWAPSTQWIAKTASRSPPLHHAGEPLMCVLYRAGLPPMSQPYYKSYLSQDSTMTERSIVRYLACQVVPCQVLVSAFTF